MDNNESLSATATTTQTIYSYRKNQSANYEALTAFDRLWDGLKIISDSQQRSAMSFSPILKTFTPPMEIDELNPLQSARVTTWASF